MTKFLWLLPMMLAFATPSASAQEICSKQYVGCMDKCGAMGANTASERCISSCQASTDRCTADVLGTPLPSTSQGAEAASAEGVAAEEGEQPKAAPARKRKGEPRAQAKPVKRDTNR